MTVADYASDHFGGVFKFSNRYKNIAVAVGVMILFILLRVLALNYLKMIKR